MTSEETRGLRLYGEGREFRKKLCDMLAETELFGDLAWAEIESLAAIAKAYEADAGAVLFREGEPGAFLCILVEGEVAISKGDGSQHQSVIATESRGRAIGEMSLLDGEPRSATCTATRRSRLILLTREGFQKIMGNSPATALKIVLKLARTLSRRLRRTSGRLSDYLGEEGAQE